MREEDEAVYATLRARPEWDASDDGSTDEDLADDAEIAALLAAVAATPEADVDLRASRVPRVRPILVVLAARAAGAAAVDRELQKVAELLHAALTVHDVALGPRNGRRRQIARGVLRSAVGWLGGNQLLLRAMELARHAAPPEALDDLFDTLRDFSEGQQICATLAAEGLPTRVLWEEHADRHTGALFAFCCRAGGHLAAVAPGEVAALGRFGRHLGRMWHVAEDVLLLCGEAPEDRLLGRVLIGRPMLPVALAVARDPQAAEAFARVRDEGSAQAASELLARLEATRALQATREVMARESWAARQALLRFPATPARRSLERFVSGLSRGPYEDRPEPARIG